MVLVSGRVSQCDEPPTVRFLAPTLYDDFPTRLENGNLMKIDIEEKLRWHVLVVSRIIDNTLIQC